jgi:hypothetical protein
MGPGDVICIEGTAGGAAGGLMRLGASGGFMGHVILVIATPRGVMRNSEEALQFQQVWPQHHNVRTLWLVRTLESTRSVEGYHESEHLMYVDERTGRIMTVGEELQNQFIKFEHPERVSVWQCPPALRKDFQIGIMHSVLAQMKQHESNWSWGTAVRAFLLSAEVSNSAASTSIREIQQCWSAEPICSSLVVVFWQRYLCQLADMFNSDALDWILRWMPLKSDRALPGELLSTMQQHEWVLVSRLSVACQTSQTPRPRFNTC